MRITLLISILFLCELSNAQNASGKTVAFPITDYIVVSSDTIQIVQVKLSDGMSIKERAVGILKSKHIEGDDELKDIGYGRCYLIKGEYYYFSVKMNKNNRMPSAGDFLYTTMDLPATYDGLIYKIARHAITFTKIDEGSLMKLKDAIELSDALAEEKLIDLFAEEVKFTGKTMLAQNDNQDMIIDRGKYKDQKLFTAMQSVTNNDIKQFLSYIIARPTLYIGKNWKFAEVFATWMSEGAPTVIKN